MSKMDVIFGVYLYLFAAQETLTEKLTLIFKRIFSR